MTDLAAELAAVKSLVARVARAQERDTARREAPELLASGGGAGGVAGDSAAGVYAQLIRAEVGEELARRLAKDAAAAAHAEGPGGAADAGGEPACVGELVEAAVVRLLGSADSSSDEGPPGGAPLGAYSRPPGSDRPLTLAFVGPTGVGKTTTVAKLAAQLKLRHGRLVGVVTLDTYRIGAVEQLRTYCSIIGTDLHVAANPEELGQRLASLRGCDVVLIDTAGRSPRDSERVGELAGFLEVARPHQTHLVLSLASGAGVLRAATERFGLVGLHRMVLTKCDEAEGCGHALAAIEAAGLPVSFVTTGQEVPHDIEAAEPSSLARRLVIEATPAPAPA